MTLAQLKSQEDLKGWIVGCDKDIGGFSDAKLEITKNGIGTRDRSKITGEKTSTLAADH